jgi:SAM-dependent methyltransferase
MTTSGDTYIYDQRWAQERDRLASLSATYDPTTVRHLRDAGVTAGWHCWEVGAGTGSIARRLAQTVGPTGRVVASDLDTRFLDGLGDLPVEVVRHDVTGGPIEEGAFDLVHARALVEHLPDRPAVIDGLVRALRPGGVLLLEDVVFGPAATALAERVTVPESVAGALGRVADAIAAGFRAIGADPEFGLRLPAALRAAGLSDVDAELMFRLVRGGSPAAAFAELSLGQLRERLIGAGLLSADDADEAASILHDPSAHWLSIGLCSAWGRRPADDA